MLKKQLIPLSKGAKFRNYNNFLLSQAVIKIINQSNWYISKSNFDLEDGMYQYLNFIQVFQNMNECLAQQLFLYFNYRLSILKQIQNVNFSNLTGIDLSKNNITNIQSLTLMKFPKLQTLKLNDNHINRIKCFQKQSLNSLNSLALYFNPIFEVFSLTKTKFNTQILKQLNLQWQKQLYDSLFVLKPVNQDLSILFKLNCQKLYYLSVKSQKRQNQKRMKQMLKQRYFKINIY